MVGTSILLDEDIDNKNLSLIVVDEKTEYLPSELSKVQKLNNDNLDIMFVSSRPLPDNLAMLLYPGSNIERSAYKQSFKCDVFVDERTLRMNAYEKATEVLKSGGQALVVSPDISFKIDEMQRTFNG